MVAVITDVVPLRWQLPSAVLMFLANTLNIHFRKSDYIGLAIIGSGLRLVSACWSVIRLLGITLMDMSAIRKSTEAAMVDVISHTPPDWPMVLS